METKYLLHTYKSDQVFTNFLNSFSHGSYLPVHAPSEFHTYSPLLLFPSLMRVTQISGNIVTVFSELLGWSPTQYWDATWPHVKIIGWHNKPTFQVFCNHDSKEHLGRMRYQRHCFGDNALEIWDTLEMLWRYWREHLMRSPFSITWLPCIKVSRIPENYEKRKRRNAETKKCPIILDPPLNYY